VLNEGRHPGATARPSSVLWVGRPLFDHEVRELSEPDEGGDREHADQRDREPLPHPAPRHLVSRGGENQGDQEQSLERGNQPTRADRQFVGKRYVQNATSAASWAGQWGSDR
jgi:hypothetical protein